MDCGGPKLVRRSRRGFFLGCAKYPECKGTRQPGDVTLAKIKRSGKDLIGTQVQSPRLTRLSAGLHLRAWVPTLDGLGP